MEHFKVGVYVAGCLLLVGSVALAGPYVSQGPFGFPQPGAGILPPHQVMGKEYSHRFDWDDGQPVSPPAADPLQVLAWDGVGGIVDSFDYSGSFVGPNGQQVTDPGDEVDAIANRGDALFGAVISNFAALLVSVEDKQIDPIAPVRHELISGAVANWASWAQVDQHGVQGRDNLDGLEVWGPERHDGVGQDDSNRFSLLGDPPLLPGTPRVSVYDYNKWTHTSTPWITALQIATAIGDPGMEEQIDVDAMMTSGSTIMFSIAPAGPFDGGEVWVWSVGGGPAGFLNHGGHLWNTAHVVAQNFGAENVDALEAVWGPPPIPEPATLSVVILGACGALLRRRRK